jgi:hypothetical protein
VGDQDKVGTTASRNVGTGQFIHKSQHKIQTIQDCNAAGRDGEPRRYHKIDAVTVTMEEVQMEYAEEDLSLEHDILQAKPMSL